MILNAVSAVLLIGVILLIVSWGVLSLGHAYPLSMSDRRVLALATLGGVGFAKWLRYLYWKHRKRFVSVKVRLRK